VPKPTGGLQKLSTRRLGGEKDVKELRLLRNAEKDNLWDVSSKEVLSHFSI